MYLSNTIYRPLEWGRKWFHITISNLQQEDGDYYEMSVIVDGKQLIPAGKKVNTLNDEDHEVSQELTVYGSSPDWESIATAKRIDAHTINNLRIMKQMKSKCIVKPFHKKNTCALAQARRLLKVS